MSAAHKIIKLTSGGIISVITSVVMLTVVADVMAVPTIIRIAISNPCHNGFGGTNFSLASSQIVSARTANCKTCSRSSGLCKNQDFREVRLGQQRQSVTGCRRYGRK